MSAKYLVPLIVCGLFLLTACGKPGFSGHGNNQGGGGSVSVPFFSSECPAPELNQAGLEALAPRPGQTS